MRCPRCGKNNDKVMDSRESPDGLIVRRRRVCLALGCTHRWTTYEGADMVSRATMRRELKAVADGLKVPIKKLMELVRGE